MSSLLLHPRTQTMLDRLAINPPQALLLTSASGSGKTYTARIWLTENVGISAEQLHIIEPNEKSGISVSQIRELYHATRTKQTSRRFFVLPHAGVMSLAAQNAFLKLLEEPNAHTYFVLTATSRDEVLPTIVSRVQEVPILPLEAEIMQRFFAMQNIDTATAAQIAFVSRGRIGLATQLAQDTALLAQYRARAADAKMWLTASAFERLCSIGKLGNDREAAITLLELAAIMATTLLESAQLRTEQQQWTARLDALHNTLERLMRNSNVKAQLTHLALTL